jgi:hypothetical protein
VNDPKPRKITRRALIVGTAGVGVTGLGAIQRLQRPAPEPPQTPAAAHGPGLPEEAVSLPQIALRGYGTVSATFHRIAGAHGAASVLRTRCESPQKALLMQAKYLADAERMPGIEPLTLQLPSGRIAAHRSTAGGCIAACAIESEVLIFAAADAADLTTLCARHLPPNTPTNAFTPRAQVPMFLDRWDRYGLLAYYSPYATNPNPVTNPDPTPPHGDPQAPAAARREDEFTGDFDFAAAQGPLGLAVWAGETLNDTAEGLTNTPYWDWVTAECRAHHLPLHINIQCQAALWLTNRYRDETMQKAPQYCGTYYSLLEPNLGGPGFVSWNAVQAEAVELGVLQEIVRRFTADPNLVGWLEPHGETDAPPQSLLVEYGPVADRSYRRFLQARYASPAALGTAWYGDPNQVASWQEVRAPELAEFVGWGSDALDLTGEWHIRMLRAPNGHHYTVQEVQGFGQGPIPTEPILPEWVQPDYDDRSWGVLRLPGNDRQIFLPRAPAVLRRSLEIPADWLASHPRVWLVLWDLAETHDEPYSLYVNGRKAPDLPSREQNHWGAVEVTGLLQPGKNTLLLRLPRGFLAYRLYLSPRPPLEYPNLGPHLNARWADFSDWVLWSRGEAVRRGAQMIRQVDPEREITLMAPNLNSGVIKRVCEDYGGHFHDTGSMAGFWNEFNALLMRGSGLPVTAEPGGAAPDLPSFHAFWGRWLTEGVQGVHYFQQLGDILWKPDIRKDFETNRALYEMVGKYHVPFADVAVLYGFSNAQASGWPWGYAPDTNLPGGYWAWNTAYSLLAYCPRDGVSEQDFEIGNVDRYRVILDSNTSIMAPALLAQIERWIRQGGTFITFAHTGRHTPTEPNSWPISRLTGYRVTHIDRYGPRSEAQESRRLRLAPGQTVLQGEPWASGVSGSGLRLQKTAADCRDLLLWEDGSVAAGVRPLGAGRIFHLGVHFETLFDRRNSPHTVALLTQILDTLRVERVPGQAAGVMMRHYISNSGLHDVWVVFNDAARPITTDLIFRAPLAPSRCFDVKAGREAAITLRDGAHGVRDLALEPFETRLFLTPRADVERAPLEWMRVQRAWWRRPKTPPADPLPTPASDQRHSLDLTEGWAFRSAEGLNEADVAALTARQADEAGWDRVRLGAWSPAERKPVRHVVLRKTFTVPAAWAADGVKQLWIQSWTGPTFRDSGRVFLDGDLLRDFNADGMAGGDLTALLAPGSVHTLALEVRGETALCGVLGNAWIYHVPEPLARQDLGGDWVVTRDGIHDEETVALPGPVQALFASRSVRVDAAQAKRNAVLYLASDGPLHGVLINGRMITRHHHHIGADFALNLTPFVRFGEENRFELICRSPDRAYTISAIELRFYDPGGYP